MSIWKDPKVELPHSDKKVLFLWFNTMHLGYYTERYYNQYSNDADPISENVFVGVDESFKKDCYNKDIIDKWCYESDLINQAKGD